MSVKDIQAFKREHDLAAADGGDGDGAFHDEVDLRAEDDALVAAALEEDADDEDEETDEESGDDSSEEGEPRKSGRRRGRRGGRRRRSGGAGRRTELEGTFDHGEEGYGLWLDPAVADDPVYAEHWAGHRPVTIVFEADRIVIRRAGEEESGSDSDDEGADRESAGASLDPDEFDA